MRYYRITFTGYSNSNRAQNIPYIYQSHVNDVFNPGALDISFDLTNGYMHMLQNAFHLRIYNPDWNTFQHADSYQGLDITIEAGFKKGLPLANTLSTKAGLIAYGTVQNCFGNWIGTEIALDFIINPSPVLGNPDNTLSINNNVNSPRDMTFLWPPNQDLKSALATFLKPLKFTLTGDIKNIVNTTRSVKDHKVTSFQDLSDYINGMSIDMVDPATKNSYQTYSGVLMSFTQNPNEIFISDSVAPKAPVYLLNSDFVGQPTFNTKYIQYDDARDNLTIGEVQSTHPLRNDLTLQNSVIFPPDIKSTAIPGQGFIQGKQLIRGLNEMAITQVRHVGRFRDMGPQGWVTHINSNWVGATST